MPDVTGPGESVPPSYDSCRPIGNLPFGMVRNPLSLTLSSDVWARSVHTARADYKDDALAELDAQGFQVCEDQRTFMATGAPLYLYLKEADGGQEPPTPDPYEDNWIAVAGIGLTCDQYTSCGLLFNRKTIVRFQLPVNSGDLFFWTSDMGEMTIDASSSNMPHLRNDGCDDCDLPWDASVTYSPGQFQQSLLDKPDYVGYSVEGVLDDATIPEGQRQVAKGPEMCQEFPQLTFQVGILTLSGFFQPGVWRRSAWEARITELEGQGKTLYGVDGEVYDYESTKPAGAN